MSDPLESVVPQTLLQEMSISDADIARRKRAVGLEPADLKRIAAIRTLILPHVDEYTAAFFDHLARLDEARGLLANKALLERAKRLKSDHIAAMVGGEYSTPYVEQRLELALLYSKAGLDTKAFLGAFHALLKTIGETVMGQAGRKPLELM